ncbi:MAG: peptidylprolyl isomerase [Verrucomicrobia bacterium]|nr:peptidylprolyl isomerase [Verrucomicrobiota bacterium]
MPRLPSPRPPRRRFLRALGALSVFLPLALLGAAAPAPLPDGLYAEFTTPRGVTTVELFYTQAPLMCVNFTGLAEGTLAPKDGKPFYTGLTWYRVVPGFVIQSGNPGLKDTDDEKTPIPHRFPDEFVPGLRHDATGILSMANAGPDTNSCEFFLTLAPTNRLNYLHSVFGRTVRGNEVLSQIRQDDPVSIKILRIGPAAKAFKNDPATFAALSARAKKSADLPAAKEPGPLAHFDDPDHLLPAEPPRAKNFNYKLANFERATGLRIAARVFAKSPTAEEDSAPGKFMKALAAKLGVETRGAVAAYFADDNDWRVWLIGDSTTPFFGRPATPADLADGSAFHDVKDAFLKAAQAEGDAAYARQQKTAPADKQPPPGQRIKLQTDAILDGLILKLDPK